MITFKQYTHVNEGVNDPAIFKAVFLAGGPGSGKSFVVGKTALQPIGFKLINSDPAFESALKKAGLSTSPEDIASEKGQEARAKAKSLTKKQMELALAGRLGLIIDGTGKDLDKITKQAIALRKIGYDVAMIFVNTDLETAQARNKARSRSLPSSMVSKMWNEVQSNIGAFQTLFGNFFVIDNSEGSDFDAQINNVYKKILMWSKKTPNNSAVTSWMKTQKNSVNEETWGDGYERRVVKTTDPEHKEKGHNWRIKGKEKSNISIKLYKQKPSYKEFTKQMKRVAGHEFGG